jgi:hypothetical protein
MLNNHTWVKVFFVAALFNYMMGLPIVLFTDFTYNLVYTDGVSRAPMALSLWADFGIMVIIIGFGYQLVSRDITKNRGLVLLGVIAKLFDVITLTYRYFIDIANVIVLIPAFIDAIFAVLFVLFLYQSRKQSE